MNEQSNFLTPAEVCTLVKISRAWLNKLVKDGDFPQPARIGKPPAGHLRYKRSDIDAWIDSRTPKNVKAEG